MADKKSLSDLGELTSPKAETPEVPGDGAATAEAAGGRSCREHR